MLTLWTICAAVPAAASPAAAEKLRAAPNPASNLASNAASNPASPAASQPAEHVLHVAAAADLQPVIPVLAAAYRKATGVRIVASFGSSATLTQQLSNGGPQDIFLSADFTHPEELVARHLTVEPAPMPYARGVLVLWARKDSPAQPLTLNSLSSSRVSRIAIANPQHAPYGLAATLALRNLNLTEKLKNKLVVAENIAQTAQFADSGNAQAGIISLTLALSPRLRQTGTFVRLPNVYPPIRQCAVILKSSPQIPLAEAFLKWLTSQPVQSKLPALGLDPDL